MKEKEVLDKVVEYLDKLREKDIDAAAYAVKLLVRDNRFWDLRKGIFNYYYKDFHPYSFFRIIRDAPEINEDVLDIARDDLIHTIFYEEK